MVKRAYEDILEGLLEELAAIEHDRWSHWQRYLHGKAIKQSDGSLLIPPDLVTRWEDQINRRYDDLSEQERESDREQVRKYLPVILAALDHSDS